MTKRRFKITVDGHTYDVEVEEQGAFTATPAPAPVSPAPAVAPVAAAPAAGGAAESGPGEVTAPLPGVVLDVKVNVGDQVAAGQVVVILEAMKMENEIVAPSAGTVKEIKAESGQTVEEGQVLVVLE